MLIDNDSLDKYFKIFYLLKPYLLQSQRKLLHRFYRLGYGP